MSKPGEKSSKLIHWVVDADVCLRDSEDNAILQEGIDLLDQGDADALIELLVTSIMKGQTILIRPTKKEVKEDE